MQGVTGLRLSCGERNYIGSRLTVNGMGVGVGHCQVKRFGFKDHKAAIDLCAMNGRLFSFGLVPHYAAARAIMRPAKSDTVLEGLTCFSTILGFEAQFKIACQTKNRFLVAHNFRWADGRELHPTRAAARSNQCS